MHALYTLHSLLHSANLGIANAYTASLFNSLVMS